MNAKKEYCGGCYKVKLCKAVHLPELGGAEDWYCKPCRDKLATVTTVEVM